MYFIYIYVKLSHFYNFCIQSTSRTRGIDQEKEFRYKLNSAVLYSLKVWLILAKTEADDKDSEGLSGVYAGEALLRILIRASHGPHYADAQRPVGIHIALSITFMRSFV